MAVGVVCNNWDRTVIIRKKNVSPIRIRTLSCNTLEELDSTRPSRGGVILVVPSSRGMLYGLGVDRASGELTDFGGGISPKVSVLDGALREFTEESLGMFDMYVDSARLSMTPVVFDSWMCIAFLPLRANTPIASLSAEFTEEAGKLGLRAEVKGVVWFTFRELMVIMAKSGGRRQGDKKTPILYSRVSHFLRGSLNRVEDLMIGKFSRDV